MIEIKKLNATIKDIRHVKILLRQTFTERREWIKNTADSISAIANEFQILINPELVSIYVQLLCTFRVALKVLLCKFNNFFRFLRKY